MVRLPVSEKFLRAPRPSEEVVPQLVAYAGFSKGGVKKFENDED